jgi:hypothetical protein
MKKFLGIAILAIIAVSCDKYEEGSNFSLLSAKNRLVNSWSLTKITLTSGSVSSESTSDEQIITFENNNTYVSQGNFSGFNVEENGVWNFNNDKTELTTNDGNGNVTTFKILKLKNDELALSTDISLGTLRYDYKAE